MGTQQNNVIAGDSERKTRVGIEVGTKVSIRIDIRVGLEVGTEQGNERRKNLGQGNKKDLTEAQSFANYLFFLIACLFFFFTISSSKSVTT